MTIKTLISAAALAFVPGLAMAEGCAQYPKQASQCGSGQTFDAATKTCVDKATS